MTTLKAFCLDLARILLGAAPWLISMYTLYQLEKQGVWTTETAHRDLMTVAIVAGGMVASFYLYSFLRKRFSV